MRKAIFFLLIGTSLAVPFGAMADTGDATTATLFLDDVINVSVSGNPSLTIDQDYIAGYAGGLVNFSGSITVKVLAITDYQVYGAYFSDADETTFTDDDELIALYDGTTDTYLPYNSYLEGLPGDLTEGFDFAGTWGTDMVALFTGQNNLGKTPTPGDEESYTLRLNPGNLGDRDPDETITFTIVFVVEEKDNL